MKTIDLPTKPRLLAGAAIAVLAAGQAWASGTGMPWRSRSSRCWSWSRARLPRSSR